jgi:hypothetical protein
VNSDTASEFSTAPSTAPLLSPTHQTAKATPSTSLKDKWRNLKEEDKKRKEEQIVHVTEEEATKITGYGKDGGPKTRREEEEGKGKGDKRLTGALLMF